MSAIIEANFNEQITFDEAKKRIKEMNMIDGFLFDSIMEDEDAAKIVSKNIIGTTLNIDLVDVVVTAQKVITGVDSVNHGIRLDAQIIHNDKTNEDSATVYDIEMENRASDRLELPKRQRYYVGLIDSKTLPTNTIYRNLPEYVSITILSYDPFLAGDMYYEASTNLITHPDIEYKDGVKHIYLYAYGNNNLSDKSYGERLSEMLKYIVDGEKRTCQVLQ